MLLLVAVLLLHCTQAKCVPICVLHVHLLHTPFTHAVDVVATDVAATAPYASLAAGPPNPLQLLCCRRHCTPTGRGGVRGMQGPAAAAAAACSRGGVVSYPHKGL